MCTAVIHQTNQETFFARTMDLPTTTPWRPVYLPAGFPWLPATNAGTTHPLPLAILGGGRQTTDDHYLLGDGMNEAGLMCAELYFPIEAKYASEEQSDKLNLTPQDFIYWALSHASLAAIEADLPTINIVAQKWYSETTWRPFHWLLADRTGTTMILEPRDEQLTLRKISLPVLTNTPNYDAHLKRLEQLLHLSEPTTTSKLLTAARSFQEPLPTGNLPTSRFQRAAIHLAQLPKNTADQTDDLMHLLDDVVIPRSESRLAKHNMDYTHYETVMNLTDLSMTFKSLSTGRKQHLSLTEVLAGHSDQVVIFPAE